MEFNQENNEKKLDKESEKSKESTPIEGLDDEKTTVQESESVEPTAEQLSNENTGQTKTKQWFQDNLRIIISILIVILIAGGIYSYSKRSEAPVKQPVSQNNQVSDQENNQATQNDNKTNQKNQENKTTQKKTANQKNTKEKTSSVATSQETEKSFIETASKGDSQTKLARRALANFLEKNPDSSLTAEHKIYIEDYLRKNVNYNKRVYTGTSVEFSKSLIKQAITKSKTLTTKQLKNLHKYAVLVPSLS